MKLCKRCESIKELKDFHRCPSSKGGIRAICKECINHANRLRYKINPTPSNERSIKWQKNNLKRFLEINRDWYARNKKSRRKYYVKNKEQIIKNRKLNPLYLEKLNIQWHKRRALLKGNGGSHTVKEWEGVKNKYNQRCAICKRKKKLTKDHIIPITKGGDNYIENIQPLCLVCNVKKGNKL